MVLNFNISTVKLCYLDGANYIHSVLLLAQSKSYKLKEACTLFKITSKKRLSAKREKNRSQRRSQSQRRRINQRIRTATREKKATELFVKEG